MFTRCPGCHTVHSVNAALLARDGGRYRCAKCHKSANALESLFDRRPDPGQRPPERGVTPVLGQSLPPAEAVSAGESDEDFPHSQPQAPSPLRLAAWGGAMLAVVATIAVVTASAMGRPLIASEDWNAALVRLGLQEEQPIAPVRDVQGIELINRQLRSAPDQSGTLQLNLTLRNRRDDALAFPAIEVVLTDVEGRALSRRTYQPWDYLASSANRSAGLESGAMLPVSIEMADPGDRAVGFEVSFR